MNDFTVRITSLELDADPEPMYLGRVEEGFSEYDVYETLDEARKHSFPTLDDAARAVLTYPGDKDVLELEILPLWLSDPSPLMFLNATAQGAVFMDGAGEFYAKWNNGRWLKEQIVIKEEMAIVQSTTN